MNKKIKVIDLIDKKYHNLELPKNIIINRMKYYYDIGIGTYYDENEEKMTLDFTNNVLNMEVEILEDNTEEIEELAEWVTRRDGEVTQQEGKRLEMCYKIDELVKAVNQIRKDLKDE